VVLQWRELNDLRIDDLRSAGVDRFSSLVDALPLAGWIDE